MRYIFILLAAILLITGCGKPHESPKKPDVSARALPLAAENADSLVYTMRSIEKRSGDCSGGNGCATVQLTFPEIVSAQRNAVADSLRLLTQSHIFAPVYADEEINARGIMARTADGFADQFFAEFEKMQQESPGYVSAWTVERNMRVLRNAPPLLSLEISEMTYTGGAHPNSFTRYINIDTRTGQQIRLADLLKPGALEKLRKIAEMRFRAQMEMPEKESWEQKGFFFENNSFELNDNFQIGDNGLEFLFNPYEIAPYAFGAMTLELPYSEIGDLLSESEYLQ